tara:strand:+ start:1653 stop:1868 length:216 start_codon:yes stop_codon:yes gene_type:complete
VRLISVGELSGRAIATVTSPACRAAPVPVGHTCGRLDLIVAVKRQTIATWIDARRAELLDAGRREIAVALI